jgi:GH25 family lysozyme M1 (1,4-beta-N-acetylmuramidase)
MFRASRQAAAGPPPASPPAASPATSPHPATALDGGASAAYLADVSEFQPDINDAAYLQWSKAVIIRAMYGSAHDDGAWYGGARRDALHAGGVAWLGIYQYLVAGQEAVAQAHALVALVGDLRPGEKLICDVEEGPASAQALRWRQWSAVITAAYGPRAAPWLYMGLDFAGAAGLSPQWVAAYRDTEPGGDHLLWQFSDSYPVPGVGVADCSVFHGTIGELAALGWQPAGTAPKPG